MKETDWEIYDEEYEFKLRFPFYEEDESIKYILIRDRVTQEEYGWFSEPIDPLYTVTIEDDYKFQGESDGQS